MAPCGKTLVRSASFKHDHAPKLHRFPATAGEEALARAQGPPSRGHGARLERDLSQADAKRHGNYPWVGRNRRPVGRGTDIASGGYVSGIGPSPLSLMGMGQFSTITTSNRFGQSFLGDRPKTATRSYTIEQRRLPRSSVLAKTSSPPKRHHYTEWDIHNLRNEGNLLALRSKVDHTPPPGHYDIMAADKYLGSRPAARFGPADRRDGMRCTTGRTCSELPAWLDRPKPRLRASRQPGPLFHRGERHGQRPRSAMESHTMSFLHASAEAERPTLKTFLRKVQRAIDAEDGEGRGGTSFRRHHQHPPPPKVRRHMWRQTSMAEYCADTFAIVYDSSTRQNVTVCTSKSKSSASRPSPSASMLSTQASIYCAEEEIARSSLPRGALRARSMSPHVYTNGSVEIVSSSETQPEDEEIKRIMSHAAPFLESKGSGVGVPDQGVDRFSAANIELSNMTPAHKHLSLAHIRGIEKVVSAQYKRELRPVATIQSD